MVLIPVEVSLERPQSAVRLCVGWHPLHQLHRLPMSRRPALSVIVLWWQELSCILPDESLTVLLSGRYSAAWSPVYAL